MTAARREPLAALAALLRGAAGAGPTPCGIVYTARREDAEAAAGRLRSEGAVRGVTAPSHSLTKSSSAQCPAVKCMALSAMVRRHGVRTRRCHVARAEPWVVGHRRPSRRSWGPASRHAAYPPPAVCLSAETAVPPALTPPMPPRASEDTAAGAALLSRHRVRRHARGGLPCGPARGGARARAGGLVRRAHAAGRRDHRVRHGRGQGGRAPPAPTRRRGFFLGGFRNPAASIGARRSLSSTRAVPYSQPHSAAAQDGQRRLTHERAAPESRARRAACPVCRRARGRRRAGRAPAAGVRLVVHFGLPKTLEGFYQVRRVRCCRAGAHRERPARRRA
jgi:hypothetical protein